MPIEEAYSARNVDGVLVITFRQSHILDSVTIDRMATRLKELIETAIEDRFLVDLGPVAYLSSSALGMLLGMQRRVVQRKGRLRLAGINDEVMEVFRITKLDTVFDIYKDEAAALEAFRRNL
jgi:anti-sigma B factor antagonist